MSFIFGGNTGLKQRSPESLDQLKQIAAALAKKKTPVPRNVGEGLSAIGDALAYRIIQGKINRAQPNFEGLAEIADEPQVKPEIVTALMGGVPNYAFGTAYHPGGLAVVGENGPELVEMPQGAQVIPAGSFFTGDGTMTDDEPGFGAPKAPKPWMRRLNRTQKQIGGLVQDMISAEDRGDVDEVQYLKQQIQDLQKEQGLITDRYKPEGWESIDPVNEWQMLGNGTPPPAGVMDGIAPKPSNERFDPNMMEGIGPDPRGMFGQEDARFDDANAYQVADAGNAISPRPATQNSVESAALGSRRGIARLTQVDAMLRENPDLLTDSQSFSGDAKRTRLEWQDYLAPGSMSEENKEYLANVSKFRMNVVNHVNLGIKEMTGAQMSNEEAKRLMKGMPNLDDSPTVFKAKLDEATYQMRLANARETYWAQKGLPGSAWEQMPLTDVEGVLKQRGTEIYTGLIESGIDAEQARQEAAQMLAREFGL